MCFGHPSGSSPFPPGSKGKFDRTSFGFDWRNEPVGTEDGLDRPRHRLAVHNDDRIEAHRTWNVRAMATKTWRTAAKAVQWQDRKVASKHAASKKAAGR